MQIAIVLYPGFTALDFIGPYESLRMLPDADVRFVWHQPGPITADSGVLVVGATHSFDETPSPDVILVPGGFSTMEHARDEKVLAWLRKAHETATWTASVCSGAIVLAAAGLLEGKRATSHWAALSALKALGVKPVGDERIVHEGDVVTCAGVSAGIDLGLWLAGQIGGEGRAKVIQLSMESTAAAVRLRPYVEGVRDDEGRGHRPDVEGSGQTQTAEGRDRTFVGPRD